MTAGTDALAAWRQHLEEAIGVAEAATVLHPFETVDWSRLATKDDLERFATKDDLERFATKDDLARFATKDDLERFATRDDLERSATKDDLARFPTRDELHWELASMRDLLRAEIQAAEHRTAVRLHDTLRKQMLAMMVGTPALLTAMLAVLQVLS